MRKRLQALARQERGQALVLFIFSLVVVIGATAMSVDVGRAMWAKSQMQEAVDAAALAGAQSLPNTTEAQTKATEYWNMNATKIYSNGNNVVFTATPDIASTKSLDVSASADIPTWFARVLGIDKWHISASAQAQSMVVDAVLVLDRSGSMCWDTYPTTSSHTFTGLIRNSSTIPNQTSDTTFTVTKNASVSSVPLNQLVWVGQVFKLDSEWMRIKSISTNSITVARAQHDPNTTSGGNSSAASHTASSSKWIGGSSCQQAGKAPYYPWEYIKNGGRVFVNSMNSTYDRIAYAQFGTRGSQTAGFTQSYSSLITAINNSYDPTLSASTGANGNLSDGYTNIAHGLWTGINIQNNGARSNASKVIVLLSDGVANRYCNNSYTTSCSDLGTSESTARSHAITQANAAKAAKIKVYTISYGNDADPDLMQQIADITGGKHYVAPNSTALTAAFQDIAKSTHLKLSK